MTNNPRNYAVETSKWYTRATFSSAIGICCGAMGMFFQVMDWGTQLHLPQYGLGAMVASIAAFAVMRLLAGINECKAIAQDDSVQPESVPAAIETSRWYTRATFWSAIGICCGALGMFFQVMEVGTDLRLPQFGLGAMVLSIAAFAVMRWFAGRSEIEAIRMETRAPRGTS